MYLGVSKSQTKSTHAHESVFPGPFVVFWGWSGVPPWCGWGATRGLGIRSQEVDQEIVAPPPFTSHHCVPLHPLTPTYDTHLVRRKPRPGGPRLPSGMHCDARESPMFLPGPFRRLSGRCGTLCAAGERWMDERARAFLVPFVASVLRAPRPLLLGPVLAHASLAPILFSRCVGGGGAGWGTSRAPKGSGWREEKEGTHTLESEDERDALPTTTTTTCGRHDQSPRSPPPPTPHQCTGHHHPCCLGRGRS